MRTPFLCLLEQAVGIFHFYIEHPTPDLLLSFCVAQRNFSLHESSWRISEFIEGQSTTQSNPIRVSWIGSGNGEDIQRQPLILTSNALTLLNHICSTFLPKRKSVHTACGLDIVPGDLDLSQEHSLVQDVEFLCSEDFRLLAGLTSKGNWLIIRPIQRWNRHACFQWQKRHF